MIASIGSIVLSSEDQASIMRIEGAEKNNKLCIVTSLSTAVFGHIAGDEDSSACSLIVTDTDPELNGDFFNQLNFKYDYYHTIYQLHPRLLHCQSLTNLMYFQGVLR